MTEDDATQFAISLGRFMRSTRHQQGITLEEAGKMVGVTHQQMQKYETGVTQISASTLYQYVKRMQVPVAAIFESVDDQAKGVGPSLSQSRIDLADARAALQINSSEVREALYALIVAIGDRDAEGPAETNCLY